MKKGFVVVALVLVGMVARVAYAQTETPTLTPTVTATPYPTSTPMPTLPVITNTPTPSLVKRYPFHIAWSAPGDPLVIMDRDVAVGETIHAVCVEGVQGQWTERTLWAGLDASAVTTGTHVVYSLWWSLDGCDFPQLGFEAVNYPTGWTATVISDRPLRGGKSSTDSDTGVISWDLDVSYDSWLSRVDVDGYYNKNVSPELLVRFANAGRACYEIILVDVSGDTLPEPTAPPRRLSTRVWPTPDGTPPAGYWIEPKAHSCYTILPSWDLVGWPGFDICFDTYSVSARLFGWDLGMILAALAAFGCFVIIWRVVKS